MVGAVAGAAALFGLAAAGAEVRRRLEVRARIAKRLQWKHGPKTAHFRFQEASLMPGMAEDADLA
jgi:hypothetical protein